MNPKPQIAFDEKKLKFDIAHKYEQNQINDAKNFQGLIDTPAWKRMKEYLDVAREELIANAENGISTRAKRDLSDIKVAILRGFDQGTQLIELFVSAVQKYIEEQKQEELEHGQPDAESGFVE